MTRSMEEGAAPLHGIRVLELGMVLAGPTTGALLGDFGADVIKVEPPAGDPLRAYGRRKGEPDSLFWKFVGRNKRAISLDLRTEGGYGQFLELARDADVVIESYRPGVMERLKLGWDVLHATNPRLVMLRLSGYGQTGPYSDRPGFGTVAEAIIGFAELNGSPDGPPMLPPFGLADGVAGMAGAYAIMLALRARERIGQGQCIDLSLLEPLYGLMGPQTAVFEKTGLPPTRNGNRAPYSSPRGVYRAGDGRWIAVAGSSNETARRVLSAIGRHDLATDPGLATSAGRVERAEEIDKVLGDWIGQRSAGAVMECLDTCEVPASVVYNAEDISRDEHFLARKVDVRIADPDYGEIPVPNVLARLSATPGRVRHLGRSADADAGCTWLPRAE